MPFERPSLTELIERAVADIETRLPGTDARLRRSNLNVLARVHAGAVHGLYGYLDYLARQLMVDTADASYLERFSSTWGVPRLPAAFAAGDVIFTGANGAVVPAGTELQRADGQVYSTIDDVTLTSGTGIGNVQAAVAGAAGNAEASVGLTMTVPMAGVNTIVTVASEGLGEGADVESDDSLRLRILRRIQQSPAGGKASDYVTWALEVPGVTRAWCYPLELGEGTVVVRFVRDDDDDLIPSAGEVEAVQAYIEERRPVTADVTVLAPTAVPMDFDIELFPDSAAVREAVQTELGDTLRRDAQPGGLILVSRLREAISVAAGETNHILNSPSADVLHDDGEIATMGNFTWS